MNLFDYFNAMFEQALRNRGHKTIEAVFDQVCEAFQRKHGFSITCVPGFTSYDTFRNKRRKLLRTNERSVHNSPTD